MTQKAYAEGMRALYLYTATFQDADRRGRARIDPDLAAKVNDLLLPIVKGVGSEQAYAKLTEPADLRRFRLPAGLPGRAVHPRREDRLALRGHHRHPGAGLLLPQDRPRPGPALAYVANEIDTFVKNKSGGNRLKDQRELLATALGDVQAMAATLTGYLMAAQEDQASIYWVGLGSVRFLLSVGELVLGWLLAASGGRRHRSSTPAPPAPTIVLRGQDRRRVVLRQNVRCRCWTSTRSIIENLDNGVMELDEAAF